MFGASVKSKAATDKGIQEEKDPERILKLKECCDMLLAGGYFRARIPTLSPFDKVAGGMVWSITASNVEVDVDIIFQENSTIGQRIHLSDQLVKAMVSMKCPHPLQSHQIQGLDYDHLFPVIQWLVRKVIETRQLTGDLVRQLSVSQFSKNYNFPYDHPSDSSKQYVNTVLDTYKPTRKFKQKQGTVVQDQAARSEATLLEYGEKLFGTIHEDEESKEKAAERQAGRGGKVGALAGNLASKFGATPNATSEEKQKAEEQARKEAEAKEQARLSELQDQLSALSGISKISGANVGNLVGMQADEIKRAAEDYLAEMKRKEAETGIDGSKRGQELAHQRQLNALRAKIAAEEGESKKRAEIAAEMEQKVEAIKASLAKKTAYNERIIRETEKLDALESDAGNKETLQKLKNLVMLNETLKSQESSFKQNCITARTELMDMINKLENDESDEETKRMLEIEQIHQGDLAKLNKIRKVLAKKNQEISRISRQIDDIPTRAELLQYERRFVELYELVAEKLVETRKYYAMYNTLEESHKYMNNEVNLLNSVIEGFPTSMKSQKGKDSFLQKFEQILEGVDKTKDAVHKQYQSENDTRELLNNKYNVLLEKQRNYFKLVKEFQDECHKNEKLAEALEKLSQQTTTEESE